MGRSNAIMLCISTAALVVLGLVMLASTSVWVAEGAEYSMVKKQAFWAVLGVVSASILAFTDYRFLKKMAKPIFGLAILLLVTCYIPGLRHVVNGEARWIRLPVIGQFQPSEMARIGVLIGLSAWLAHFQSESRSFKRGFVQPGLIMLVPVLLIFFEKDMGTAVVLGAACFLLLYVAGTRIRYLVPSAALGFAAFYVLVRSSENRWNRIMAFQDLEAHKLGFGLQQWRGLLAFGNGGIDGLGLGNGAEKHGYLPFAHTDFIFPMVGEELGLWFTLGTVFCFVIIALYGIGIAVHAPDLFGRLLAVGITCSIVIQGMLNIGVTTALLPNTGLPLPFISYGGTNLVFTLAAIGILISIHRQSNFSEDSDKSLSKGSGAIRI